MRKTSIKRLYEADDIQQPAPLTTAPQVDQFQPAIPQPSPVSNIPSFDQFQNQEETPQAALPQPDVMTLSVQELMDRCQQINPLICMGLQQFIDANREKLLAIPSGADTQDAEEDDINFSKQMEPASPEFSLDNEETLEFPQQ